MKTTLAVPFHKLHALRNDFIVSNSRDIPFRDKPGSSRTPAKSAALQKLARAICDRHTGIGADGFLLAEESDEPSYNATVRFFNADGSEAEMSGNGIRCVGVFLTRSGRHKGVLKIRTKAGIKMLNAVSGRRGAWEFRVGMGEPVLEPEEIPFGAKGVSAPVVGYRLDTRHGHHRVTVTSMGNPHCSLFVKNFDRVEWPEIGREIELHPLFPNRTNVEFVKVISPRKIEVRFWERGVGITASSGTGSCAAAVAAILNGFADRSVAVETVAGRLQVRWLDRGEIVLTGPAVEIAHGVYEYARS